MPTYDAQHIRERLNDQCSMPFKSDFVHTVYLGALACSHAKWMHKLDFPAFDWPIAEFPQVKYPLEENVEYNRQQENKSIQDVSNTLCYKCIQFETLLPTSLHKNQRENLFWHDAITMNLESCITPCYAMMKCLPL